MTGTTADVMAALGAASDPTKAARPSQYFKTGPGEYGEGDEFLGLTVPVTRKIVKPFHGLLLDQVDMLLEGASTTGTLSTARPSSSSASICSTGRAFCCSSLP